MVLALNRAEAFGKVGDASYGLTANGFRQTADGNMATTNATMLL